MIGRWTRWNAVNGPEPYVDSPTYQAGADWLADCDRIEDWGCGRGWLSTLVGPDRYVGVDGASPFATVTADLTTYRSTVAGIFMRHVLEHNREWWKVLDNAAASATRRLFIALFTPLADQTQKVGWSVELGVPDLAFRLDDLLARLDGWTVDVETIESPTQYGVETMLRCNR